MPVANYLGKIYNLPFNMHTFTQLFPDSNLSTPKIAKQYIESLQIKNSHPKNLEEQALSLVGEKIYQYLIKGYTEKQWGKNCKELPTSIITRLPLRFTYNNNYFNDTYQGIPINGYTDLIQKLINGAEIILNYNYVQNDQLSLLADKVFYSGQIDKYYNYKLGILEYRRIKI
jgi:UDP-galactopyranose mutase